MRISRRTLLKAGLSAAFLSLVPKIALAGELSPDEKSVIGPGSLPGSIYRPDETGTVDSQTISALTAFATWAIDAWGFENAHWDREAISSYLERLKEVISMKTEQKPSYLSEYKSAGGLIKSARDRLGSDNAAFVHLMFVGREKADELRAPRLIRARRFVFDEITRHILSNGGFRSLGLVNYEGYMGGSFYDEKSFRRGKA